MSTGSNRGFQTTVPLDGLTMEQFLVIGLDAARQLQWNVGYLAGNGFIAQTPGGGDAQRALIILKVENGIAEVNCSSVNGGFFDRRKNKKIAEAYLSVFNEIKMQLSTDELAARYRFLLEYNQFNIANINDVVLPAKDQYPGVVDLFIPRKDYFITPLIIDANLLVFIIMAITGVSIMEPDNASLLRWGANFRPLTLAGEWWRLIACYFLHIGVIHLLMNLYALFFIGLLLEPHLGKMRFLAAYMLTGIAASTVSLWWHSDIISAGASGAVFGMYGFFLAMLTSNLIEKKTRSALLLSILFFVGYNLANGMKGGIDNAAHIGGLVSGLILGYISIPGLKKPMSLRIKYASIVLSVFLVLTFSSFMYKTLQVTHSRHEVLMNKIVENEKTALELYKMPAETPKETVISLIQQKGLPAWNENIKLLEHIDNLKLSGSYHERNRYLKIYTELRIHSYETISRSAASNSDVFRRQLDSLDNRIKATLDTLNDHSLIK